MAKMKRNIGELVSGKIGNVVFVQLPGKSYVRAAPVRKSDNWSTQQLLYRKRMSSVSALWRKLRTEEMKKIFNLASQEMNGYALFIKDNIQALSIDGTLIDPALLNISEGHLSLLQNLTCERESAASSIKISWENDINLKEIRLTDRIFAQVYKDGSFTRAFDTHMLRKDLTGCFSIPESDVPQIPPSGKVTIYIYVSDSDAATYSKSQSFNLT